MIVLLVGLPTHTRTPFTIPAAVLGVLTFGGCALILSFERRGDVFHVDISEIPLLVGIVFAPARVVLVARGVADSVYNVGALRQPAYRAWFNTCVGILRALVAIQVYDAVLGGSTAV